MDAILQVLSMVYVNKGLWIGLLVGLFFSVNYLVLSKNKQSLTDIQIIGYIVFNTMFIGYVISQIPRACS